MCRAHWETLYLVETLHVVSWANHIQAIHSQLPILQSTKLLRQLEKKLSDG